MALSSLQLDAFLQVTKTLSFTKAAENLYITQSALSQRILNLETELGVTLFIRHRSGLKLTEIALDLVRYCQFKNQCEDEFVSSLKDLNSKKVAGILRVGGFSSVMRSLFLPATSSMLIENPSLRLHMLIREVHELYDLLKRNEIDYMISTKVIERDDIECVFLGFEENVLIQKKNYQGQEIYLDHDENDEVTLDYLKRFFKKQKKIQRLYLDDVYGIIEAAKLGMGIAVLPMHLVRTEKSLDVLNNKQVLRIPVYLCYYKQPYYTRLHDLMIESVTSYFRNTFPIK